MTSTASWEAELAKNAYGDSTFAPPVEIAVRQTKSIRTQASGQENEYDGLYWVYLSYQRDVKAGDLINGKRVSESRDVLDALGEYNHTKILVKIT